ncbi:hypothetical protein BGZ54_003537 [Gamsiella multidivaricata]|nr:hypothetical protein BGZ54_003537 [Gamsiella multidivaricata]
MRNWNISYYKLVGEASSVDLQGIEPELKEIAAKLDRYELDDIYNCKHIPNGLLATVRSQVYLQPTDEKRVDYMRKYVFASWLRRLHESIIADDRNRKIVLLIDNAPGHLIINDKDFMAEIPNIEVITLPKNSTSPESIRNCFRHVPIFNNCHKNDLSFSVPDKHVMAVFKNIRLNIHQINQKMSLPVPEEPIEVNEEYITDEHSSSAILRHESVIHWSATANLEDIAASNELPQPSTSYTLCQLSIPIPSVYFEPSPFNGISNDQVDHPVDDLSAQFGPEDSEPALLLSTPQQHYGRLSRELGRPALALQRIEEMRSNRTYIRFFKTDQPSSINTNMLDDFDSSDDDQDIDFHTAPAEDVPTSYHPRTLVLGHEHWVLHYCVDETPSSPITEFDCLESEEIVNCALIGQKAS